MAINRHGFLIMHLLVSVNYGVKYLYRTDEITIPFFGLSLI